MIEDNLEKDVRKITPKSEEEFLTARDGDLVKVAVFSERGEPQYLVYEHVSGTEPSNDICGFLEQDNENPVLIRRWDSLLSRLQFGADGASFNHLYRDQKVYDLTTPGFGYRLELLRRAGKLNNREIKRIVDVAEATYSK